MRYHNTEYWINKYMLINEIQMDRILILKRCRKNPNHQTLVAANLKIMVQYKQSRII